MMRLAPDRQPAFRSRPAKTEVRQWSVQERGTRGGQRHATVNEDGQAQRRSAVGPTNVRFWREAA